MNMVKALIGAGCFWGIEEYYRKLNGVIDTKVGYSGGNTVKPTYEEVCTGKTGHAEVTKIEFDSNIISFEQILNVFWQAHDPTTLNRQGNDVGSQYRSVIFYHNNKQKRIATESKEKKIKSGYWSNKIVTDVTKIYNYSDAEDYHNDYYNNNPNQPYCLFVIKPKLDKLTGKGIIK